MTFIDTSKIKDQKAFDIARKIYGDKRMQRQIELERWASERGEMRWLSYNEKLKGYGRFDQTDAGKCAIQTYWAPYAEAIEWQLDRKQRGARAKWKALLMDAEHVDVYDIATIALRTLLSAVISYREDLTQQQAARAVMENLRAEISSREFNLRMPIAMNERMRRERENNATAARVGKDVREQMRSREIAYVPLGFDNSATVMSAGVALVQILAEHVPGLVQLHAPMFKKSKKVIRVSAHPALIEAIEKRELSLASIAFSSIPLVVPPVPWGKDTITKGGYYTKYIPNYPMVKRSRRLYALEVQNTRGLNNVCDALNTLQETGWRINRRVAEVLHWLFNHKEDLVKDFARMENPDMPPVTQEEIDQNPKRAAKARREHHLKLNKLKSKRLANMSLIEATKMFWDEESFYFSWDMDSRGRAYPRASTLSPQGSQWSRFSMEFACGQLIEKDEDMDGIRFNAATCFGLDKLPHIGRIKWTKDNLHDLLAVARDPYSNLLWTEAEEPAGFLASCFELLDYEENGFGHVSRLPVAVDATCSGLQILSALSRDEVGGRSVNLTDEDIRYDIYSEVAEGPVRRTLEEVAAGKLGKYKDFENAQEYAQAAIEYGFDRKLTKRVTMTVPYAATEDSCREYVREYYHDRLEEDRKANFKAKGPHEQFHKFSVFMAKIVWDAIPQVVVRGLEIMRWLQQVSVATVKSNPTVPLQWETPDGFVGRTNRPRERFVQPRLYIYDYTQRAAKNPGEAKVSDILTKQWTDKEDAQQHRNSCAPNVVHSLDATHLRMVVRRWRKISLANGEIPEMAMIHDSFAVGTRDFKQFNATIREEFFRLYTDHDCLAEYEQSMREIAGQDVVFPARPSLGKLELSHVLSNQYFFS